MAMTFEESFEKILKFEGGEKITDDKDDSGGLTRWGVSQNAFPDLDIRNLTREAAREIYHRHYWLRVNADKLPVAIRFLVFDAAVNQGAGAALIMLQDALGVKADGVIGPVTLKALSAMPAKDLLLAYAKVRMARYRIHSKFEKYGAGWLGRLMEVTIESSMHLERVA